MEVIFENVSLKINKNTPLEKTILRDINFEIKEPGIYSFFGNSNSGKTAIGDLIDALVKPTKGSIKIFKEPYNNKKKNNINKLRFMVGYIFKNPYDMFFNKSVKDEIEFGMKYFKYKLEKIDLRAIDALKMVGLGEEFLQKDPFDLSLSEARKIALASVLVYNPKIIILDEPTTGIGLKEKRELSKLLKLLKEKYNKIIIILSKDANFIYPIVDRVFLMNKTRIVKEGTKTVFHDKVLLNNLGLQIPFVVEFVEVVKVKKNINLGYYKDIKDLIKAVYRNVF